MFAVTDDLDVVIGPSVVGEEAGVYRLTLDDDDGALMFPPPTHARVPQSPCIPELVHWNWVCCGVILAVTSL